MYSPERLALECLIDADEHNATIANYAEAVALSRDSAGRAVVTVRDAISGDRFDIRARVIINAAGPWADGLARLQSDEAPARLVHSKGIHMVVRAITTTHALTVPHKGRHFFVIPWRDHSLIGTTDTPYSGSPDDVTVTSDDLGVFLAYVNDALPDARLQPADVVYAYAGLRPLVAQPGVDNYKASRRSEVIDHGIAGGFPLLSVIGGKWTSSRALAERCVDLVASKAGVSTKRCDTATARLPGAASGRTEPIVASLASRYPHVPHESVVSAVNTFGSRATRVLDLAIRDTAFSAPVSDRRPNTLAEVLFTVRQEMALSLDDVLFRRTGIGTLGTPGRAAVERIAGIMAMELGWSPEETQQQMLSVSRRFRTT
jgi:glycerol-3-phosphate dehydrogenase